MPRGKASIVLVYPNTPSVGSSNMGFISVFRELSSVEGLGCDRAFLPAGETVPKSVRTGEPISKFGTIAFSVSFENDYLNLLKILILSGINPLRKERNEKDPLIICGGVSVSLNPLPLSPFVDALFLGEAEGEAAGIGDTLLRNAVAGKKAVLDELSTSPYFYVPARHGGDDPSRQDTGRAPAPRRNWIRNLDEFETYAVTGAAKSTLGSMLLVELGRGCGRGCRFCAAGYLYRPPRARSSESVFATVLNHKDDTRVVGLVSPSVSDYPGIDALSERIAGLGKRVSVSSMRPDSGDTSLLGILSRSGTKSVTLAPEVASQRMRNIINKRFDEAKFLDTAAAASETGLTELKLYFLVGLPGEKMEDVEAVTDLVLRASERFSGKTTAGKTRRLVVSVNPFVPKPQTPFQWDAMEDESALKKKMEFLKNSFARKTSVKFIEKSIRQAVLQSAIARGCERTGMALFYKLTEGVPLASAMKKAGLDLNSEVFESRTVGRGLPWDFINSGVERDFLLRERKRAEEGKPSAECDVTACKLCGVC